MTLTRFLLTGSLCLFGLFSFAQLQLDYFNHIKTGGRYGDPVMEKGPDGSIFVAGVFRGTVDFDPSAAVLNKTAAKEELFICKYDSTGALGWVYTTENATQVHVRDLAISKTGEVAFAGFANGFIECNPGGPSHIINSYGDALLLKLNAQGQFKWGYAQGAHGHNYVTGIDFDSFGNVYSTGTFAGTVDFDPGPGVVNRTYISFSDIYVQKVDSMGNFLWVKIFASDGVDNSTDLIISSNNQLVIVGSVSGKLDFDSGPDSAIIYGMLTDSKGFAIGLDLFGNFQWLNNTGRYVSKVVEDSKGRVIVSGMFDGLVDFDRGSGLDTLSDNQWNTFAQKISPSGIHLSVFNPTHSNGSVRGGKIALDQHDNIYIAGTFESFTDFDPSSNSFSITPQGMSDAFLAKYDSTGKFVWVHSFGQSGQSFGKDVLVQDTTFVYFSSYFNNQIDISLDQSDSLLTAQAEDLVLLKIIQPIHNVDINESIYVPAALYPSPSTGELNIQLPEITSEVNLSIQNMNGQNLFEDTFQCTDRITLHLNMPKGIYLVTLITESTLQTTRWVVM